MKLLSPAQLGPFEVQNRVFMAPLTRSRANNPEAAPTELHTEYYQQRASAGLIITEATVVSTWGVGYINVPGIYSDAQVKGWKKVTDAVHEKNGKIFCQLWHVGRMSHPDFHNGKLPLSASANNPETKVFTENGMTDTVAPKAMTIEEIKSTVNDFKVAAENAMKAGFDGVEIHASNGYLFHQFFNNCSNKRTDEYGGNDENKTRFLFEVLEAIKSVVPENKIGIRLNPMMHESMGMIVDDETAGTFDYVVKMLNNYDLAYLHLSRPFKPLAGEPFIEDVIGHYRKLYDGFLVANANYDQESGEAEVSSGRADAIAFGKPFISNPDLPARFENDWPIENPDSKTFYTPGPEGYTTYPAYQE